MKNYTFPRRQRGVALFIGLAILIVFALIGISAMNNTLLQERMAGSMQGAMLAFNASESALREGEQWLLDLECPPPDAGSTALIYDHPGVDTTGYVDDFWYDYAWPSGVGQATTYDFANVSGAKLSQNPVWLVEELPPLTRLSAEVHGGIAGTGDVDYFRYRITGRATGASGNEYVITQSTLVLDCIS